MAPSPHRELAYRKASRIAMADVAVCSAGGLILLLVSCAPAVCFVQFAPEQRLPDGMSLSVVEPQGEQDVSSGGKGGLRPTSSRLLPASEGSQYCTFRVSGWTPPGSSTLAGSVAWHLGSRPLERVFEVLAEKPWAQMAIEEKMNLICVTREERDGLDRGTIALESAMRAADEAAFEDIIKVAAGRGHLRMDGERLVKLCRDIVRWNGGAVNWVGHEDIGKLKPDSGVAQAFFTQWAYALETKNKHRVKLDVMLGPGRAKLTEAVAGWRFELEVPDRLTEFTFTVTRLSNGYLKITVQPPAQLVGLPTLMDR